MIPSSEFSPEAFSLDAEEAAHRVCRIYESHLRGGAPVSIASLLTSIEASNQPLALYELVRLDAERRRCAGELPESNDYAPLIDALADGSLGTPVIDAALQATVEAPPNTRSLPIEGDGDASSCKVDRPRGEAGDVRGGATTLTASDPPQHLGRYTLVGRLGQGGMGTVFRAYDARLRRCVALKIPHFSGASEDALRERFRREALALAALRHDMIVSVHDVDQVDDYEFMTMALIEGAPLRRYIDPRRPLAGYQAATLVCALAKAMHYVHQCGVVHRDLKPENIIMDEGHKPVIVDFGLARAPSAYEPISATAPAPRSSSGPVPSISGGHATQFGPIGGTPGYCAPEQLASQVEALGPQVDVYSLGVVLFELLTGRLPFDGGYDTVLHAHASADQPSPRADAWNPQVDAGLADVCALAMERDVQRRFASMEAFAEALSPFCASSNAAMVSPDAEAAESSGGTEPRALVQVLGEIFHRLPMPQAPDARTPSFRRRRRVAALALAASAFAIPVAVVYWRPFFDGAPPSPARAESTPNPSAAEGASVESSQPNPKTPRAPLSASSSGLVAVRSTTDPGLEGLDDVLLPAKAASEGPSYPLPRSVEAAQRLIQAGAVLIAQVPGGNKLRPISRPDGAQRVLQKAGVRVVGLRIVRPSAALNPDDLSDVLQAYGASINTIELVQLSLARSSLAQIASLMELTQLKLHNIGLRSELVDVLSDGKFSRLEYLDLGNNGLDGQALDRLLPIFDEAGAPIRFLSLQGASGLSARHFGVLSRWKRLEDLNLADAQLEADAVPELARCTRLTRLNLNRVKLGDDDLGFLGAITGLQSLGLERTPITDRAVDSLVALATRQKGLQSIELEGTRLTSAGLIDFAERARRNGSIVEIIGGDRLAFSFRVGSRRDEAIQRLSEADVLPAIELGLDWLVKTQLPDGSWGALSTHEDLTEGSDRGVVTAMALLALQGYGHSGLSDTPRDQAVRRAHQWIAGSSLRPVAPPSPNSFEQILTALAICDLHAFAGYHIAGETSLPQADVLGAAVARCLALQKAEGSWGDSQGGSALLTSLAVETLLTAQAAGYEVDASRLGRAQRYLESLWNPKDALYDGGKAAFRCAAMAHHASATSALRLLSVRSEPRSLKTVQERLAKVSGQPHYCSWGSQLAADVGGDLWKTWQQEVFEEQLLPQQVQEGELKGSWHPLRTPQPSDEELTPSERTRVVCQFLLSLESCFRRLPQAADASWRVLGPHPTRDLDATASAQP